MVVIGNADKSAPYYGPKVVITQLGILVVIGTLSLCADAILGQNLVWDRDSVLKCEWYCCVFETAVNSVCDYF